MLYIVIVIQYIALVPFQVTYGIVVCHTLGVSFWHIPKTGGSTVQRILQDHGCAAYIGCPGETSWAGVYTCGAHISPQQLYGQNGDSRNVFLHEIAGNTFSENAGEPRPMRAGEARKIRLWPSFAFVRNPYTRVLSAFDQMLSDSARLGKFADVPMYEHLKLLRQHSAADFSTFMKFMARLHMTNLLCWREDPWQWFRPASMYTHWHNGSAALTSWGKFETFLSDLLRLLKLLVPSVHSSIHGKRYHIPKLRARNGFRLCKDPDACHASELLRKTLHTRATLCITNYIYQKDFALLGYTPIQIPNCSSSIGLEDTRLNASYVDGWWTLNPREG